MNFLLAVKSFFEGKKTYVIGIITAVYGLLVAFDWVNFTPEQELAIFILLSALLGVTIRAGISKK